MFKIPQIFITERNLPRQMRLIGLIMKASKAVFLEYYIRDRLMLDLGPDQENYRQGLL